MRLGTRDAIAVAVFALGALLVRLAWHPLGPWLSLGIAVLAALVAVVVYRARPPLEHAVEDRSPVALHRTEAQ
jgi:hypothetical protein